CASGPLGKSGIVVEHARQSLGKSVEHGSTSPQNGAALLGARSWSGLSACGPAQRADRRSSQAQRVAQARAGILLPVNAALLQLRHHELHEILEAARLVCGRNDETVAARGRPPLL